MQGAKCRALGAADVLRAASELAAGSPGVEVLSCKCLGRCKQGPAMRVKASVGATAVAAAAGAGAGPAGLDASAAAAMPAPAASPKGVLHTHVELQHLGATLHAHWDV